jgi:integrase
MGQPCRVPSYRLHKPTNQAIVTIRGKMFYLGRFGSEESHAEYRRVMAEHWARKTEPPTHEPAGGDRTITELAVAYYRHCEDYYVKNGKATNQVRMIRLSLKVLRELYGATLVKDFGPLKLEACQAELIRQGLSRREVNRRVQLIRQAFRWATSKELAPPGLYHALQAVAGLRKGRTQAPEPPPVGPVPEAIVERTIEYLCPTVAAMVRLQLASAMRPGELVIMRACDLNMSGPIWEYRPDSHKGEHHERDRVIMLGPKAQEIIRPLLGLDISGYLFSPKRAMAEQAAERRAERKTKLWPSHEAHQAKKRSTRGRKPLHDHYDVNAYRRAIARACDRAFPHPTLSAIPRKKRTAEQAAELKAWRKSHQWHPHQLRHSTATVIRRQFGIEAAQAVLGHSQIDTSELYAEKSLEAARQIMQAIG